MAGCRSAPGRRRSRRRTATRRTAARRSGRRAAGPGELRGQDRADRARIDRAVRVPAGALVDRADVQAGAAADAVQRLAAHRVGEHRGAAVVEQHQVELLRPVAGVHPGPHRGVRVHPLAGRRPGQQLQEHLEVGEARHDLLDAHHGDQGLRQGQAHPAVALGLDHGERAGLGDAEVGAADRDLGGQELSAQVRARRHGQRPRLVGEVAGAGHLAEEDLPDLGAVAVDRRHQDVDGLSWPSCTISSARSVSTAAMPGGLELLVEPDLLGGHRLDLDHLVGAGGPHQVGDDPVGLVRVAGPVHHAAAGDRRRPRAARAVRAAGP